MHASRLLAATAAVALAMATPGLAQDGGRPLSAHLTGAAEKPNPGDPDGGGHAHVTVNVGQAQVCWQLMVEQIAPATMAHIHKAPADASGPVVVKLDAPSAGKSSGCAAADAAVVKDILQNPGAYYVNVHNAEFPGGAVRGQLGK